MPTGLLIGAAAAPIAGGLIGSIAASGSQNDAQAKQAAALAAAQGLSAPDAAQLQVDLAQYQNTGQMSPFLQSVVQQQGTALSGITTDPALKDAQMAALQSLQQQGQGKITPQQLANIQQTITQGNQQAQAQNASALAQLQQQGQGHGGAQLAAMLSNGQNAANQTMQAGLTNQGQAYQNALAALSGAGNLATTLQTNSFGQQAQQASAQDVINQFNAANAQQVQAQNVAAQTAAQNYNVQNAQQVANLNTQTQQQQALQNSAAQQQAYNDALQKAQLSSGALNNAASQDLTRAGQTQSLYTNLGQGVGQAATTAALVGKMTGTPSTTTAGTTSTGTGSAGLKQPALGSSAGYGT
jgi:hypothetical protein